MTTYTTTPATMHSGHDIRDAKGSMVAIVHNPKADPAEGAHIAALMAAAPDLLAALEHILKKIETGQGMGEPYYGGPPLPIREARAAISRATGVEMGH
jgi:hypothetical protein